MLINNIEYRDSTGDWCKTCVYGPEPNKKCMECLNIRVLSDHTGTKFAAPTNYEKSAQSRKNCVAEKDSDDAD